MANRIVRAVDVGYGNTKFTLSQVSTDGEIRTGLFASLAPKATGKDLTSGVLGEAEKVVVSVEGVDYAVGKDALSEAAGTYVREVASAYSTSDIYLALFKGALHQIDLQAIDYMVVGLPLTTYEKFRHTLEERLTCVHEIPHPRRRGEALAVDVRNVKVFPQPAGAFYNYSIPQGLLKRMMNQTNLVIDAGFGTLDWFVAEGTKPDNSRSSATSRSVWEVVRAIASKISTEDITRNARTVGRIDQALREGRPVRINGKEIDLAPYASVVSSIVHDAVSDMMRSIGDTSDIDNILLTGGGAHLFRNAIGERLGKSHQDIVIDRQPVFSNVCGFQLAGELWAKTSASARKAA